VRKAGQPPLFQDEEPSALTEAEHREALFRRQVELGIAEEQARAYADRFVFKARPAAKPRKAASRSQRPNPEGESHSRAVAALFGAAGAESPASAAEDSTSKRGLLPVLHPNRDFFLCDLFDYALKDDGVSMEAPIFTLATKPDTKVWHWESKDKSRAITVTPSVLGRATQHDKDLLIYVVSQITEALNRGRQDAVNRTVRFRVHDYLVATNKGFGGKEYQRLQEALERLRGTSIKTNIQTGGERVKVLTPTEN
jgi:plasmid replication initiation protein